MDRIGWCVEGFREAVLFNRVYNVYWLSALLLKSKNVHFAIKHARLGPYKGPLLQGYLVILITCHGPIRKQVNKLLNCPIFNFKVFYSGKLFCILGYQRSIMRKNNGSN